MGEAKQSVDSRSCGSQRVIAGIQYIGGGIELIVASGALLAPEPTGATKVVGSVVLVHGIDTIQSSLRRALYCDSTPTSTQSGVSAAARLAGAGPSVAETDRCKSQPSHRGLTYPESGQ